MWTEPMKERVWELAKEGASSSTIARAINKEFATAFTKNAVIGMCHRNAVRLGLPAKAQPDKRKRPRKIRSVVNLLKDNSERRPSFVPVTPVDDWQIPIEQRRTVLQLTEDTCRFPVGEVGQPDFFFCGALPERGSPYCARHTARATTVRSSR